MQSLMKEIAPLAFLVCMCTMIGLQWFREEAIKRGLPVFGDAVPVRVGLVGFAVTFASYIFAYATAPSHFLFWLVPAFFLIAAIMGSAPKKSPYSSIALDDEDHKFLDGSIAEPLDWLKADER